MGPPPRGRSRGPPTRSKYRRISGLQWGRPREGGVGGGYLTKASLQKVLQWGRPREGGVGTDRGQPPFRAVLASMGPPPRGRSRLLQPSIQRSTRRLQWGRPREGGVGRSFCLAECLQIRRFNGAAPERAESGAGARGRGPAADASMGPPPRGRSRLAVALALLRVVLASMGPPPRGRSRSLRRRPHPWRDPASMGPPPRGRSRSMEIEELKHWR